jgi:hypothetical protein
VEKPDLVVAPDKEKNHFLLQANDGPDRDTMKPTKEPCRVGTIFVVRHYLSWQRLARPLLTRHGEGRRVPARILPPGPALLRLIGK